MDKKERLLALYHKMPMGNTKRKIVAKGDKFNGGNLFIFLKGNEIDAIKIRDFVNGMEEL